MATQVQMSVASANISNADTTGYSEKTANQAAVVSTGGGAGTAITGITSSVDKLLLKSLSKSNSELGSANTLNNYLDQLQSLYGSSGSSSSSGTSIANTIASLESAISSLASTTSSASLQSNAVSSLDDLASQLREHVERNSAIARQCRQGHRLVGRRRQPAAEDDRRPEQADQAGRRVGAVDGRSRGPAEYGGSGYRLEDERQLFRFLQRRTCRSIPVPGRRWSTAPSTS